MNENLGTWGWQPQPTAAIAADTIQAFESVANWTTDDLDQLADTLNQDGICVIRNLLPRPVIEEWAAAFEQLFWQRQQQNGGLAPRDESRYYLTLPWVAPFANAAIYANPIILGVLNRVLGSEYSMVQLGADVPLLGSTYQEIHRDFSPLFNDQFVTPLYALAVNFPLVEVTAENGPFQMARGTHVLPREVGLAKIASGEIPLESFYVQPGDVMIRSPLALHRGSPNLTQQPRPMMVMGYVRNWLQTAHLDLSIPRAYYDSLPEAIQKMLRCQVIDQVAQERVETYINFKY